jgi:two-component system, cell cycle sensor histidine kinase and response regulator CckA
LRAAEESAQAPAERSKSFRGTGTILLVEDEKELRAFATRALEFQGYRVFAVGNGREALQFLQTSEQPIDLVLTDVVMPDMGGLELAEHLREEHVSLPILLMSGYSKDFEACRWGSTAHVGFLPKPFGSTDLAKKVRDVLEQSRRDANSGPH